MEKFKAYRIFEENGKGQGRLVDMTLDELDAGAVVIKVAYSSVNFKDALAGTGAGKIVRRYPCVGGIDSSGTVVTSSDSRFNPGDEVICTSYDFAMSHDGGYAGYKLASLYPGRVKRLVAIGATALYPGLRTFGFDGNLETALV